jgi:UDP-glucuronate decarboxylase
MDYHREHNLEIKIARIFNTYGPNMAVDDGRVVSNFICQALNNKKITINGDGTQTRSFQYIDDLIDGLIKMMETDSDFVGPLNLGNPDEISINKLASRILKLTKSKSEIIFNDLPSDDPKKRKPEISLAFQKLDWKPKYDLDFGLINTINYFDFKTPKYE